MINWFLCTLACPHPLGSIYSNGNIQPRVQPPSLHLSLSSSDGNGAPNGELSIVLYCNHKQKLTQCHQHALWKWKHKGRGLWLITYTTTHAQKCVTTVYIVYGYNPYVHSPWQITPTSFPWSQLLQPITPFPVVQSVSFCSEPLQYTSLRWMGPTPSPKKELMGGPRKWETSIGSWSDSTIVMRPHVCCLQLVWGLHVFYYTRACRSMVHYQNMTISHGYTVITFFFASFI